VIKRKDIRVGEDKSLTLEDYKERVKFDVYGLYKALRKYFVMIHELFNVKVKTYFSFKPCFTNISIGIYERTYL